MVPRYNIPIGEAPRTSHGLHMGRANVSLDIKADMMKARLFRWMHRRWYLRRGILRCDLS